MQPDKNCNAEDIVVIALSPPGLHLGESPCSAVRRAGGWIAGTKLLRGLHARRRGAGLDLWLWRGILPSQPRQNAEAAICTHIVSRSYEA